MKLKIIDRGRGSIIYAVKPKSLEVEYKAVPNQNAKIALAAASPKDLARLNIEEEFARINDVKDFSFNINNLSIEYRPSLTKDRLTRLLSKNKPNILHFSGHGSGAVLYFRDQNNYSVKVDKKALAELLIVYADTLECVILNACYSKEQAELLAQYIPNVIGTSSAIGNEKSIKFSELYYQALFNGRSYKEAFEETMGGVGIEEYNTDQSYFIFYMWESSTKQKNVRKELTYIFPTRNPKEIQGRKKDLEKIRNLFTDETSTLLVHGIVGTGKTTFAEAYVSKYYDDYDHIAWVNLGSGDVKNDFVNTRGLIRSLGISSNEIDIEILFEETIMALRRLEDNINLLVLDNATANLINYKNILPQSPNWHILITSKEPILGYEIYDFAPLAEVAALDLFMKHCSNIKDQEKIKGLLRKIDYHPLTIEILAKTANQQNVGIGKLEKAIKENIESNISTNHIKDRKVAQVYTYLASVFDFRKLNINEEWLMQQFVCLPSNYIPYNILLNLINPELTQRGNTFSNIINDLVQNGWIQKNKKDNSFKMHGLIKEICAQKLHPTLSNTAPLLESVSKRIRIDQTRDNPVHKIKWLDFGESMEEYFSDSIDIKITYLQYHLGCMYRIKGEYEKAKTIQEKVLKSNKKNFGENHYRTANSYSDLGLVLVNLGFYNSAEELLQKALRINKENYRYKYSTLATCYSNLGQLYFEKEDYVKAKEMHEKALFIDENKVDRVYPNIAISLNNLGVVLNHMNEYKRPKILLERALLMDKVFFGEKHPTLATRYFNLGAFLKKWDEKEEAKKMLKKALKINRESFGDTDYRTAASYSMLGAIYNCLGNYCSAKILLEKGFNILHDYHPYKTSMIISAKRKLEKVENDM